jgi:hypothetical protein
MGYTTDFTGRFEFDKPLTAAQVAYLKQFSETRRIKRDAEITATRPDPLRMAVGLPVGIEGGLFVGALGLAGQEVEPKAARFAHESSPVGVDVIDSNDPPDGQPGLWCNWTATDDGMGLEWNGTEKFYRYNEWLEYLIANVFRPWGVTLSGEVKWQGEDPDDRGTIYVENNEVEAVEDQIVKGKRKRAD